MASKQNCCKIGDRAFLKEEESEWENIEVGRKGYGKEIPLLSP